MQVALGLGCDRDASLATVQAAVTEALARASIPLSAVCLLATIDKKRDEPAILALAEQHGWPLRLFSATELSAVAVRSSSEAVRRRMGTPAVAEAAALLAAETDLRGLVLEKHKHTGRDGKNATVAIARLVLSG